MISLFHKIKEYINGLRKVKLLNDSFWSLFGNVINKGLAIVAGIIIARFLGKDIFGEYSLLKSTFVSAALFSSFGLQYTSTKFIAEYKKRHSDKLHLIVKYANKIVLAFSGIIALLLIINAGYIAEVILEASHLSKHIRLFAILIVLNSLTSLQIGFLAGFGKFKEMSRINIIVGIVTFLLSVILVYFYGFYGALLTLLLVQLINLFLNYNLVNKSLPTNTDNINSDRTVLNEIIKFSTPIALQEAIYSILSWTIIYLILRYASFGEVGLYRASLQLNGIIMFIPGILRNVVLSHLSETEDNEKKHSKVMNTVLGINFIATFIPALILFIAANYVAKLYGDSFDGLGSLLRLAVFITVFASISNVYAQAYMSKGMNWMMLTFRFIRDGGTILLFIALINYSSSTGAEAMIYSQLFLNIVFMIIMIVYYKSKK